MNQSSLCEILLLGASLAATLQALRSARVPAALGFALLACAALAGAIEYSGIVGWGAFHSELTRVVTWLSFVLLILDRTLFTRVLLGLALFGLIVVPASSASYALNVAALAYLASLSWAKSHWVSAAVLSGIAMFAIASLVIGSSGQLDGVPRRDVYHLLLAAATALIMQYFRPIPRPSGATSTG